MNQKLPPLKLFLTSNWNLGRTEFGAFPGCLAETIEKQGCDILLVAGYVFERCLAAHGVTGAQRTELLRSYREAVASLHEDNLMAE